MLELLAALTLGIAGAVAAGNAGLRERLLTIIDERPGLHASSICRSTGSPWSTVQYQLDLLARSDLVAAVESGRTKRFFPLSMEPRQIRLMALLHEGRRADVARFIQEHPGIRQVDICQSIDISRKTFRRAVEALIEEGLVQERRGLQDNRYFPQEPLGPLLSHAAEASSDDALDPM